MTIKELIVELQKFPEDMTVEMEFADISESWCFEVEQVDSKGRQFNAVVLS